MLKKRIRDYGLIPGTIRPGKNNSITDVPGVKVGHWTLKDQKHNTGVTVIIPRENIFLHKCTAAAHVINGFGKTAGLMQVMELGQLETPIALTNTMNVGLVSDALIQYTIDEVEKQGKKVVSVNTVVGECNDARLNTITERVIGYPQVMEAIRSASEEFEQGCVGAGAGTSCHGLKAGIGSASRIVEADGKEYTVGILLQCNHGEMKELSVLGKKIGPEIKRRIDEMESLKEETCQKEIQQNKIQNSEEYQASDEDRGSCMIILATDLPLSSRQLTRLLRRTAAGLARCGSYWGHASGDVVIGFTTAHDIDAEENACTVERQVFNEEKLDRAFAAAAEASEEAVLNALAAAVTTKGPAGNIRYSIGEFADLLHHVK